MSKIRIGIVGTGLTIGISDHHETAYSADPRAEITGIFDVDRSRALVRAKKWKLDESIVCASIDELLERVDAVSICTPNSTHEELIASTLGAGKHALCEKPLAHTLESAHRVAETAKKHPDCVAMVSFNYRDIPAVRYMKRLIDDGAMGKIYTCRMQLGGNRIADPHKVKLEWRMQRPLSGSGALADFGCHMIDLTDYLLSAGQGKIADVKAFTGTFISRRDRETGDGSGEVTNDDSAVINGTLEGGTLLSLLACRLGIPRFSVEIVGEGGMLLFSGTMNQLDVWLKDKDGGYDPAERKTISVDSEYEGREGHRGIISDFLAAIERRDPYERSIAHGLYIQEVLDRLEKSIQAKGAKR